MSTDTITLKNSGSTITATLRYPMEGSGYPLFEKNFTKERLADGSFVYDYPEYEIKRRWEMTIDCENVGDDLLTNLNSLFALSETLYLDIDVDAYEQVESNIPVAFEGFRVIPIVGDIFNYELAIQEL